MLEWTSVPSIPSALAANRQSSSVLIEPAPLLSQSNPDEKLVNHVFIGGGFGGSSGEGGSSGGSGGSGGDAGGAGGSGGDGGGDGGGGDAGGGAGGGEIHGRTSEGSGHASELAVSE